MKLSLLSLTVLAVPVATAFAPSHGSFAVRPASSFVRMSEAEVEAEPAPAPTPAPAATGGALVPIKEETVEFTAGLVGGAIGFTIGGPVLALITAAAANYVSKSEGNEIGEVVSAVSRTAIQIFNYLSTLDNKYQVLEGAKNSLSSALDKLKAQESVDPEVVTKVEKALKATTDKIEEVNDEYDLVGGGLTALGIVGDLVETAITKAGELNEEYKLTAKAKEALSSAVEKAKSSA